MFLIDEDKNEAISISKKTFKELRFGERNHLQEWIRKNPDILGEKLLIIQKEFSGFDDTRERLDLLAIDKSGNLVIIENKLDDSGRDVVWQSLKYASYCSGLTKNEIKNIYQEYLNEENKSEQAEEIISEFLENTEFSEVELNNADQRIIMVAAYFRKEVTSTAMWLLDHNIKLKCIKVTPYELEDKIILNVEQIIPVVDAEDYLIKIVNKKQEELQTKEKKQTRHTIRIKFWEKLLQEMNNQSNLFRNISPSKDNWISCGSGVRGLLYQYVITGNYARIELWINRGSQEENKEIFDDFYNYKKTIESSFGNSLEWQRLDKGKGSRIVYILENVNVFNEEDWHEMITFMTTNMVKLEASLKNIIPKVIHNTN